MTRDLRADIAAEAGALATYEALLKLTDDEGSKKALHFLATREVAHTKMFMDALNSINKLTDPLFGDLQPDQSVNVYFNMSFGPGADLRGPWNREPAFRYVANPLDEMDMPGDRRSDRGSGNGQGANRTP